MRNLRLFSLPGMALVAGIFVVGFVTAWVLSERSDARQAERELLSNEVYQNYISKP